MSRMSVEQMEAYAYRVYLLLLEDVRMSFLRIGNRMNIDNRTAAKIYRWALREEIMPSPFLRLNSFPNYQEYAYFLKFKDAASALEKLKDDHRVIYQSVCGGAFDLLVMTSSKIDVSTEDGFESIFLSGSRSDFIFNKVKKKSMELYIDEFCEFLKSGNFIKSKIIFPEREKLVWDELDWSLFRLLKHDARRKYLDIIRRLELKSKSLFYEHLNKVLENCTIWTAYFPKRYPNYEGYFVLIKTAHESQLVEKLREMPVHCQIYKVKDWICATIMVERDLLQRNFLNLLRSMQSSGFVEECRYSISIFYWNRT